MNTEEFAERFWEKVDKGDPEECWEWQGATVSKGYGSFWISDGKVKGAHRVSAVMHGMQIDGMQVLHECDNPPCVNPNHLYVGTHEDNMRDREERHEWNREGEKNENAKLTTGEIREIKKLLRETDRTQVDIAEEYGISNSLVSAIERGKYWSDVGLKS